MTSNRLKRLSPKGAVARRSTSSALGRSSRIPPERAHCQLSPAPPDIPAHAMPAGSRPPPLPGVRLDRRRHARSSRPAGGVRYRLDGVTSVVPRAASTDVRGIASRGRHVRIDCFLASGTHLAARRGARFARWCLSHPEFARELELSKMLGCDDMLDQMIEIADAEGAVIDLPVNRSQRIFYRRNVDPAKITLPWLKQASSWELVETIRNRLPTIARCAIPASRSTTPHHQADGRDHRSIRPGSKVPTGPPHCRRRLRSEKNR